MARCHHHSGYLADDEAGHTAHVAQVQPSKKPLFPEMGPVSKQGYVPHPPLLDGPGGNPRRHRPRGPQPFGNFLDFLNKGQVLDSLQTVVEEATERVATMKTEGGVPLLEVQDPVEEPSRRRARVRPSFSTVHWHRVRPGLCTGRPNNYPSHSSSASHCRSSLSAGCPGDLGARGSGLLPPLRDRLLLEKNLKRLLKLENKGKGLSQAYSQRGSLPWDLLGRLASGQQTLEQPLSWFSGLLGSSSGLPEALELGPTERELIFLKRELNKEIQSWLSCPEPFALPGYCALREPHLTLDFLAKHRLFPALQHVVSQAVDKLSAARRHDGHPLFATATDAAAPDPDPLPNPELPECPPNRNPAWEEPYEPLPTMTSSPKMAQRRSTKTKGRGRYKEGGSTIADTQVATRFRLKVIPTEDSKGPGPSPPPRRQEASDLELRSQKHPLPTSTFPNRDQTAQPWRSLHLTLPGPGVVVNLPAGQARLSSPIKPAFASPYFLSSHLLPMLSPSGTLRCPEVTSVGAGRGGLGMDL